MEAAKPLKEHPRTLSLAETVLRNKLEVVSIPYQACLLYKEPAQVPVVASCSDEHLGSLHHSRVTPSCALRYSCVTQGACAGTGGRLYLCLYEHLGKYASAK